MTFIKKLASYFSENVTHRAVSLVGLGTPYFQIIPFLVNFLNLKDIYSILHGTWFWCSKSKNPDNLYCHRQELTLVAETLAQETIIILKSSSVLIEIKALSLFFFQFWKKKKKTVQVILNFFHLPCHVCHIMYVTSLHFCDFAIVSVEFQFRCLIVLPNLFWNC